MGFKLLLLLPYCTPRLIFKKLLLWLRFFFFLHFLFLPRRTLKNLAPCIFFLLYVRILLPPLLLPCILHLRLRLRLPQSIRTLSFPPPPPPPPSTSPLFLLRLCYLPF
ncbi:hypothetical protein BDD12DRAFT_841851 [Trichophaea hybrida]|nr:hypothetical protein BDD12DRAFT_841851 [Trichophaea hybrida]